MRFITSHRVEIAAKTFIKTMHDQLRFLEIPGMVVVDYEGLCHGYCLMDNHYHLIIETLDGNLSKNMRQLNGVYTQVTNRRHGHSGHLFQGRYKVILVDKDRYLLKLLHDVVLNPLRVKGRVHRLEDWLWSSYLAMVGDTPRPALLTTDWILSLFGKRIKDGNGTISTICPGRRAAST